MFADRQYRVISYHDTWISIDPIQGCPYQCVYCVLRHSAGTGKRPQRNISPKECVAELLEYPFFVCGYTPVAIGNETDIFHKLNVDYLIELLVELSLAGVDNPIILVTKAPLSNRVLSRIRTIEGLRLVLFLSYSGLGKKFEPNFTDEQLRMNFLIAKKHDFPVVHYWRPLLPENTTRKAIGEMLSFVSSSADASVFIGLKIHPELTRIITRDGILSVPERRQNQTGEWLEAETIKKIYREARRICPEYPLYRHSACALASVLKASNHTATFYRRDVCPPSHCPMSQRQICESERRIPQKEEISGVLSVLGRDIAFERHLDHVLIDGGVSQEEFAFLLHNLKCPLKVRRIKMQNLYRGDIYKGQRTLSSGSS